eukprot:2294675-Pleurochrysis_carterae.AAC.4
MKDTWFLTEHKFLKSIHIRQLSACNEMTADDHVVLFSAAVSTIWGRERAVSDTFVITAAVWKLSLGAAVWLDE